MRHRLTRHSPVERNVLMLLRTFAAGGTVPETNAAAEPLLPPFSRLAACAVGEGLGFCPVEAAHVGPDELNLLGWLALLQREHAATPAMAMGGALHDALEHCADILSAQGNRLPYRAMLRAGLVPANVDACHERGAGRAAGPRRYRPSARPTLKDKAVAYARSRGIVSTQDLGAIGISRQYLSMICLEGALIRVRYGHYRAPEPDMADQAEAAPSWHRRQLPHRPASQGAQ